MALQAPAVAVFHPDLRSPSQRGIHAYATSLLAALRRLQCGPGLVTDLRPTGDFEVDRAKLAKYITRPAGRKRMALAALPDLLAPLVGHLCVATRFPADPQAFRNERDKYLALATEFVNIGNVYEACRLASSKPFLPAMDIGHLGALGYKATITTMPSAIRSRAATHKIVQTVHDLIILNDTVHDLNKAKFKRKMDACARHSDLIIAVSNHTRQAIIDRYPQVADRTVVLYQPLPSDDDSIRASENSAIQQQCLEKFGLLRNEYAFYVGSVEERKNVARLIRAHMRTTGAQGRPLVIAGAVDKKYTQAEGIDSHFQEGSRMTGPVRYIGRVSETEKLCLLRMARFSAFPSITEGFGIPILEAQSMACPVITTNTSAMPEVSGSAAVLVDNPLDVEEIIHAMESLWRDDRLNLALRSTGIENSDRFHRDRFTSQLGQLLADL